MSLRADDRSAQLRVAPIVDTQRGELLTLLAEDPYAGAPVECRVRPARSLQSGRLGGPLLGVTDRDGGLRAAVLDAGALQVVGGGSAEWSALAGHLARRERRCGSLVGHADAVATLWQLLRPHWGPSREERWCQPLLVTRTRPADTDVRVRPATPADLDAYVPAAAAMFAEELGIDALGGPGGEAGYRERIRSLIAARRAYALFDDDGSVMMKADLGASTPVTCQVQGVWVRPDLRGQGLGTTAMAAVLHAALDRAPSASLYVNDFNTAARRLYDRLGMAQVGTLSTVLF